MAAHSLWRLLAGSADGPRAGAPTCKERCSGAPGWEAMVNWLLLAGKDRGDPGRRHALTLSRPLQARHGDSRRTLTLQGLGVTVDKCGACGWDGRHRRLSVVVRARDRNPNGPRPAQAGLGRAGPSGPRGRARPRPKGPRGAQQQSSNRGCQEMREPYLVAQNSSLHG
jgi:hypothetical protein